MSKNWVQIFQLQSMSNAIRCINQSFVFKNFGISCLALISNLSNLRTTILHAIKRMHLAKHFKWNTVFFTNLTRVYGLALNLSCCELSDTGWIPAYYWNSLPHHSHSAWNWASQYTDTLYFLFCCALFNYFSWISSVVTMHWQGFNSEHEHPTSTLLEHLE